MKGNTNKTASAKPRRVKTYKPVEHYIRAWRIAHGWTINQLAHEAGLTESFISQLERGYCNYTQPTLTKIADALKVKPYQLLASEPKPTFSDGTYRFTVTNADGTPYSFTIEAKALGSIPFSRHVEVTDRVKEAVEKSIVLWQVKSR